MTLTLATIATELIKSIFQKLVENRIIDPAQEKLAKSALSRAMRRALKRAADKQKKPLEKAPPHVRGTIESSLSDVREALSAADLSPSALVRLNLDSDKLAEYLAALIPAHTSGASDMRRQYQGILMGAVACAIIEAFEKFPGARLAVWQELLKRWPKP